jgi:hypothetical protein
VSLELAGKEQVSNLCSRKWNPEDWTSSDDRVRGGKSQVSTTSSNLELTSTNYNKSYLECSPENPVARFHGNLDIQTLGGAGFASQRTRKDVAWDLSAYNGIHLVVTKSDSKCHFSGLPLFPSFKSFRQTLHIQHQGHTAPCRPGHRPRTVNHIIRIRLPDTRERNLDQEERTFHSMGIFQCNVPRETKGGRSQIEYHEHQAIEHHDEKFLWNAGGKLLTIDRVHFRFKDEEQSCRS